MPKLKEQYARRKKSETPSFSYSNPYVYRYCPYKNSCTRK